MTGRLVIVSGPSGVGKDTVLDAWMAANPRVRRVVACTTRPPRPGEVDGVDYHFLSHDEFHQRAKDGAFLEFKEVHGKWYATPLDSLNHMLAEGQIVILKIDVQGALEVLPRRTDALSVFILPPSVEELERRIRGRGTEDETLIATRLVNAQAELAQAHHYHVQLVNDDVNLTVRRLQQLVDAPTSE